MGNADNFNFEDSEFGKFFEAHPELLKNWDNPEDIVNRFILPTAMALLEIAKKHDVPMVILAAVDENKEFRAINPPGRGHVTRCSQPFVAILRYTNLPLSNDVCGEVKKIDKGYKLQQYT